MRIELQRVQYMPRELAAGILYVSEEFGTAAHLCACGCGSKIRTPLGPTEWRVEEARSGPTLDPSVGNWQHACQSHYWINRGEIVWAGRWTSEQIADGRRCEQERRHDYYEALDRQEVGMARRLRRWVKELFER